MSAETLSRPRELRSGRKFVSVQLDAAQLDYVRCVVAGESFARHLEGKRPGRVRLRALEVERVVSLLSADMLADPEAASDDLAQSILRALVKP